MPSPSHARRLAGACLGLLLAACASLPELDRIKGEPLFPRQVELGAVPFFPQDTHQCGPAALATVLTHAGRPTSPEVLAPQVFLPERAGSLQLELMAATRRHGLLAYPLAPALGDLLAEVAAGHPVLVLQNLGLSWLPLWHYAVVVGYDLDREEIVLRSGTTERAVLSLATFQRTWARGGSWGMLALPPGRLPARPDEARYVAAAVALERSAATGFASPYPGTSSSSIEAAHRAYAAALARWPTNLAARMGLGNTAYALGRWREAEAAFRQAIADHPDAWMPWNNLAYALARQQRTVEAVSAAREAVRLSGQAPEALATLAEIAGRDFRKAP